MLAVIERFWPLFTAFLWVAFSVAASLHALLYKRDSRATVGWVGVIWLAPVIGSFLYIMFGINRVRRRVHGARRHERFHLQGEYATCTPGQLRDYLPRSCRHLQAAARLVGTLTDLELLHGNSIEPLINGDETYPAMTAAIDRARVSVSLTTYIFDNDPAGTRIADALAAAVKRGVEVRVLIDSVGVRYSIPPISHRLRSHGVRTAHFMPTMLPWATPYFNLRSHRKIMVVDGNIGFTGGMNIRYDHMVAAAPPHPARDIHFRLSGPVVHQLQATFVEDWLFNTREQLSGHTWFPPVEQTGTVIARAIPDGPDRNFDRMRLAFLGALAVAQHRVRIITPYFLPDSSLIAALNTCAMRGVQVDIILPQKNNLHVVAWAAQAQLWQLLEWGCRIWFTAPPFDHSKILTIDGNWCIVGSANWDPRSLRLNFEFGVECYNRQLVRQLDLYAEERIADAREITLEEVNNRSLPIKIRDAAARLAAPYL